VAEEKKPIQTCLLEVFTLSDSELKAKAGKDTMDFLRFQAQSCLKVPKGEIFDRSDFPDFYIIKSSWVGDLVVKIITYYFDF
jgi:hypothetical protein